MYKGLCKCHSVGFFILFSHWRGGGGVGGTVEEAGGSVGGTVEETGVGVGCRI